MRSFVATLVLATVCLWAHPAAAGSKQTAPLSVWKVKKGAAGSAVGARVICRTYSPVVWANVGKEISEIRVKVEWLNSAAHVDSGLRLTVKYYDWSEETLFAKIPRNARHHELVFKPAIGKGRKVKQLELGHGQSGMHIEVHKVRLAIEQGAVFMNQSALGSAKLHAGINLRNNLIIMQWDAPGHTRPYLTNVRAKQMKVLAGKSTAVTTFKNSLYVTLRDKNGHNIKTLTQPVNSHLTELTFSFAGIDMSKVERVVFAPSGSGVHMHIRRIIVGSASPPASGGQCAGVKPLNSRFEKLLNKWMKQGTLGPDEMPEFMKLLQAYRTLE